MPDCESCLSGAGGGISLDLMRGSKAAPGIFIKVGVTVPGTRGRVKWVGYAGFPEGMEDEARRRASLVQTPNDIEDLLREFADERSLEDFQAFRAGHPQIKVIEPESIEIEADSSTVLPLDEYDNIIVSFSGGKDSLACVLGLLEAGVPPGRIELWHQCVDGHPGRDRRFFDWPSTESYCRAVARALGCRFLRQWREGGFLSEMMRGNPEPRPTARPGFELEEGGLERGLVGYTGGKGPLGTRLKFPAKSGNLGIRWCSSSLKIDPCSAAINNLERLDRAKILLCTGERRQESVNRATYATVDEHKSTTLDRRVDQWRPVIEWREEEVWGLIRKFGVRPHPAYFLGWGRLSCFPCIFGSPNQWASVRAMDPELFAYILSLERQFDYTIDAERNVEEAANLGRSFVPDDPANVRLAFSEDYSEDLVLVPEGQWTLPLGALGQVKGSTGGPT